ncbi:DUF692 domain-containing protein [bacterium]|nr:DUF692 domain-containing protein [bacterium]
MLDFPALGFGCGLRVPHYEKFLTSPSTSVDFIEVIAETFIDWTDGTRLCSREILEKVRENYPVAVHGVSLSLGSQINLEHLKRVKSLLDEIQASWFSDHLCWTGTQGQSQHDLFPLPYNEEAIRAVVENILRVQDFLKRPILIENLSSYVSFESSEMQEWEFLSEIARRSDCGLLLDINNIYVSSRNHHFNPQVYLDSIPFERVGQIHLAGHDDRGDIVADSHSAPVCDAVWDLYAQYARRHGVKSTLIEWDDLIPPWERLEAEVLKAKSVAEMNYGRPAKTLASRTAAPL